MAQLSAICMFFEVVCLAFLLQYIYAAIKAKVTVEEIGDTFINVLGDMYERHRFRTIVIMLGASILAYNPQKFAVRLGMNNDLETIFRTQSDGTFFVYGDVAYSSGTYHVPVAIEKISGEDGANYLVSGIVFSKGVQLLEQYDISLKFLDHEETYYSPDGTRSYTVTLTGPLTDVPESVKTQFWQKEEENIFWKIVNTIGPASSAILLMIMLVSGDRDFGK